jgi:hypothetical protein
VHAWLAFAVDATARDSADNQIVIAGFATARDFARQMGERGREDRNALGVLEHEPLEGALAAIEAFAEVLDQIGLPGGEDVDCEAGPVGQQVVQETIALDGHRQLRRVERALLHPTGEHAGLDFAVAGGQDE